MLGTQMSFIVAFHTYIISRYRLFYVYSMILAAISVFPLSEENKDAFRELMKAWYRRSVYTWRTGLGPETLERFLGEGRLSVGAYPKTNFYSQELPQH